ncbi:histidine phosphotransferase family protein [Algimonas porphyrae]|uniref:Histidine phosphotransferase n=1 Tax=Algimonas porphyrae TaxID=1128113 RepID=A0ABQ5V3H5_9PROT|nr:histidine phosphotransferase family protein [Algimonas porphyrae]GLQ22003.1 histidine phosphotransferase [Algimonas porphyrae]
MSTPPKLTPSSLAALLCARICHDLVSPVGALGTAIEILDDDSNADMHDDALALIKSSSRRASAKLKFLRLAFGAAGSAPGVLGTGEITALVDDMFDDAKADIVYDFHADGVEKSRARLLLNLAMLGVQAVPRGGSVTLSSTPDALSVVAVGPRARLDETVERALNGRSPDHGFDGRSIQPFYASMMAREGGGHVTASAEDEKVVFRADFPA